MAKHNPQLLLCVVVLSLAFLFSGCSSNQAQATPATPDVAPTSTPFPTPTPVPVAVLNESVRFEVFFEMSTEFMQLGSRSAPVLKGDWDGKSTSHLKGSLSGQLGALESIVGEEDDLSLEYIETDGRSCGYAPVGQATRDAFQNDDPEVLGHLMRGKLVDLVADNWVCLDHDRLAEITDSPEPVEPLALLGITSLFDPARMADALYEVADVTELGEAQVRGVDVKVYSSTVAVNEWMRLISGSNLDTNYGQLVSIAESTATLHLEFFVGSDRRLHRIRGIGTAVPQQNQGDVTEHGEGLVNGDISVLLGSQEVNLWMQVDLFDHAVPIEIELPSDYIDAAPIFEELYEGLNG